MLGTGVGRIDGGRVGSGEGGREIVGSGDGTGVGFGVGASDGLIVGNCTTRTMNTREKLPQGRGKEKKRIEKRSIMELVSHTPVLAVG